MDHTFQYNDNAVDKSRCAKCNYPLIAHSDLATCEACSNRGPVNIVGSAREYNVLDTEGNIIGKKMIGAMLLCANCEAKEKAIPQDNTIAAADPKRERIVELLNALDREIPLDSRAYFNAEITSIVDVEHKIAAELGTGTDATQFKLAEAVESRLRSFKQNLFQVKQLEHELKVNLIADQRYLNQLVPKLREEEREKFRDYDITYKPPTATPTNKPAGTRTSAKDKSLESFAKMMGISIEQAQIVLNKSVAATIKCTCVETPGLCKVHPKTN